MRMLLATCVMLLGSLAGAAEMPTGSISKAGMLQGVVLEVINVQNFTYLKIESHNEEIWAAVINTPVKKGSVVTIEDATVMNNFESKTLKRTFPVILFGKLGGAQSAAPAASVMGSSYLAQKQKSRNNDKPIDKATGASAHTVAEIVLGRVALNGKTVSVRGKVVKYNPEVMGKNWVHVQDGSGSASDNSNDILVTTKNSVKIGEVVTLRGVVRIDQDFGAGYAYKVLIEDAILQ